MAAGEEKLIWFAAALALAILPMDRPLAHHGMGEVHWYDPECCSFKDCHPVGRAAIKFTGDGWLILDSGQYIPEIENGERNARLRVSKDLQNHLCRPEAGYHFSPGQPAGVICLYIAPPGL